MPEEKNYSWIKFAVVVCAGLILVNAILTLEERIQDLSVEVAYLAEKLDEISQNKS